MQNIEKPIYDVSQKIHDLTVMSLTDIEIKAINELTAKFDDEDMNLINKLSDIHFKIGFRNAVDFLR